MLNNYFCGTPLESSSVFWKSGENFNPKQLTKLTLADDNITGTSTQMFPWEFSKTSKTVSTAVSVGELINYY